MEKRVKEENESQEKWTTITLTREGCDYIYVVPKSSTDGTAIHSVDEHCGNENEKKEFECLKHELEMLKQELPGHGENENPSEMLILSKAVNYINQLNSLDQLLQRTIMFEECRQEELFKKLAIYGPAAYENIRPAYNEAENESEGLSRDFTRFGLASSESTAKSKHKKEVLDEEFLEELNMWEEHSSASEPELTSPVESDLEQDSLSTAGSKIEVSFCTKATSCSKTDTEFPLQCVHCKASFARERHLLGHRCPAKYPDFFDPTEQEEEESWSEMEMERTDTDSDWKSESSDEENSDVASATKEAFQKNLEIIQRKGKRGRTGVLKLGPRKSNFRGRDTENKKIVVVDENVDLQLECSGIDVSTSFERSKGFSEEEGSEFVPVFSSEEELLAFQNHMEKYDLSVVDKLFKKKEDGDFVCSICSMAHRTEEMMREHCLTHTKLKPYKCPQCELTSSKKTYVLQHMRKHTGNLLKCNKCNYRTWIALSLYHHYNTHRNILFVCKLCRNDYSSLRNLMLHIRRLHVDKTGREYLRLVKSKLPRRYFCRICEKVFLTENDRMAHRAKHHTGPSISESKRVTCNFCPYMFSDGESLTDHYKEHEWIFVCCVCSNFHSSSVCLKKHLQDHVDEAQGKGSSHKEGNSEKINIIYLDNSNGASKLEASKSFVTTAEKSIVSSPDHTNRITGFPEQKNVKECHELSSEEHCVDLEKSSSGTKTSSLMSQSLDLSIETLFYESLGISWYVPDSKTRGLSEKSTPDESESLFRSSVKENSTGTATDVRLPSVSLPRLYKPLNESIFHHILNNFGEEECLHCGKHFPEKNQLDAHTRQFHSDQNSSCSICVHTLQTKTLEKTNTSFEAKNVTRRTLGTKGCKCIVVDEDTNLTEAFDDIGSLFLTWKNLPPVFSTKKEGLEFQKKMNEVSLDILDCMFTKNSEGTTYCCNFCKMVYRTKTVAREHCLSHTNLKPYKCPQCSLSSGTKSYILQHMRKHTGNWLNCSKCDYKTWNTDSLHVHMESHSNILFACKLCHANRNSIQSLLRHVSYKHKDHLGAKYLETVKSKLSERKAHIHNMRITSRQKVGHNFCSDVSDECNFQVPCKGHRIVYVCCICFSFHSSTVCLKLHIQEHGTFEENQTFYQPDNKKALASDSILDSLDFDCGTSSLNMIFARSLNLSWYMPDFQMPTETVSKGCFFTSSVKWVNAGGKKQKISSAAMLHLQKLYRPLNETAYKELTTVGNDECLHCGKFFPNRGLLKSHLSMNHERKEKKCDLCLCVARKETLESKKKLKRRTVKRTLVTSVVPLECNKPLERDTESTKVYRRVIVDKDTDLLNERFKEALRQRSGMGNNDEEINILEWSCLVPEAKLPPVFSTKEEEIAFKNKLEVVDLSSLDYLFLKRETKDDYICTICSKVLSDLRRIRLHCKIHTDLRPYRCSECDSSFPFSQTLFEHMRIHTGNMLKCSLCNFTTWIQAQFRQHQDTHLNIIFVCKLCSREFKNISYFQKHVRQAHVDSSGKDYLAVVDTVIKGGKPFACAICNLTFSKAKSRNQHLRQVHDVCPVDRYHSCCLCCFTSREEIDLKLHYTNHLFIFICSVCFSAHASVADLKNHFKIHLQTSFSEEQLLIESVCRSWYLAELEKSLLGASEEDPLEGTSTTYKNQTDPLKIFAKKVNTLQKLPSAFYSIVLKKYKPLNNEVFQKMREVMGNEECINCGRCFHKRADLETHILEKHATTNTVTPRAVDDGNKIHKNIDYLGPGTEENKDVNKESSSIHSSPSGGAENITKTVQTRPVFGKRKITESEKQCPTFTVKESRNSPNENTFSDSIASFKKQRFSTKCKENKVEEGLYSDQLLPSPDNVEKKQILLKQNNEAVSQSNAVEEALFGAETDPKYSGATKKEHITRSKFEKYVKRLTSTEGSETTDEDSNDADPSETSDPAQSSLYSEETNTHSQGVTLEAVKEESFLSESVNFNTEWTELDKSVFDETFIPVFSTEEGRLAFEKQFQDLDLGAVDDLFTKVMPKLFSCNVCKKTCKKKNGIIRHCLSHTDLKPYKCPNCGLSYSAKDKLLNHMRKHTGNMYTCPKCDFKTDTKMSLVRHYQRAHEGCHTICRLCGKVLTDLIYLESHISSLHNNGQGEQYLAELKLAKKAASQGTLYTCRICNQEFTSRASRNRHLMAHKDSASKNVNTIKCCLCPFVSTSRDILKTHFREHKIAYVCTICRCLFPSYSYLQNHLQEHVSKPNEILDFQDATKDSDELSFEALLTESLSKSWYLSESTESASEKNGGDKAKIKPSKWEYCQLFKMFSFFLPVVLQVYKKLNFEIFQQLVQSLGHVECMQCGCRFFNSNDLESHVISNHSEKELNCDICGYTTMEIESLQEHVNLYHKGKKISCKHCSFVAASQPLYLTHLESVHGVTAEEASDITCPFCKKKFLLPCRLRKHLRLIHKNLNKQEIKRIVKNYKTPEKLESETNVCPYCNKGFSSDKTLEKHIWVHKGIKPFKCSLCDFETRRMIQLKDHMAGHRSEKNIECDICHRSYKTEHRMKDHRRKVHGKYNQNAAPVLHCDRCSYSTRQRAYLRRHKDAHDRKEIFSCDLCDFNSKYIKGLKAHSEVHKEKVLYICDKCDYDAPKKAQLIVHIRIHEMKYVYSCSECDYKTHSKTRFREHMGKHAKASVHSCDKCGYKTRKITFLRKHLAIHGVNTLYVCTECDYTTDFRKDYREHVATHDTKKPLYWCDTCDYSSSQAWVVDRHKRVHDGEELAGLVCEKCNYSTSNEHRFKRHVRCHDRKITYCCYKCDFCLPDRSKMKSHMLMHDRDSGVAIRTPFRCSVCGYFAFSEEHLKKHKVKHQGKEQLYCEHCEYSSESIRYMKTHYTRKHRDKPFSLSTFVDDSYAHNVNSQDNSSASPMSVGQPNENAFKCLSCSLRFDKGTDLKEHLETEHKIVLESVNFEAEEGLQVEIHTTEGEEDAAKMSEENQNVVLVHFQEADSSASDQAEDSQTIQLMEVEEDLIRQIHEQDPLDPQMELHIHDSESQLVALNSEAIVVEQDGQYVVPDADGSYVIQCISKNEG